MYAWQGTVGGHRGIGSLGEAKLRYGTAKWAAMEDDEKKLVLHQMDMQLTDYVRPTSTQGWRKPVVMYYEDANSDPPSIRSSSVYSDNSTDSGQPGDTAADWFARSRDDQLVEPVDIAAREVSIDTKKPYI